jgi:hypothetical protein
MADDTHQDVDAKAAALALETLAKAAALAVAEPRTRTVTVAAPPVTRADVLSLSETAQLLGIPRSTVADLARAKPLSPRRTPDEASR